MPPPDLEARFKILNIHTSNKTLGSDVDLRRLAEDTELFTGAELGALCREAATVALREDMSASVVFERHFQKVKNSFKPTLTRAEIESYSSFTRTSSRSLPRQLDKTITETDSCSSLSTHFESGLKLDNKQLKE